MRLSPAGPATPWWHTPSRSVATLSRLGRRLSRTSSLLWHAGLEASQCAAAGVRDPVAASTRLAWLAENLLAVHGVRVCVRGAPPQQPCIVIANHLGYLDPAVLLSVVPACPIAKRELGEWPVLGPTLARLGVVLVRRGDAIDGARALRAAESCLRAGASVLVFPEGTTSGGDAVLALRPGPFALAKRLAVPLVPAVLRYSDAGAAWIGDDWFLPHYVRTLHRPSLTVTVEFGAMFAAGTDARHTAAWARMRMQQMLARLGSQGLAA